MPLQQRRDSGLWALPGGGIERADSLSDESTALRWVAPGEIAELPMHRAQRLRLRHAFEERAEPYLG
ncbi:hypothetical protein [Streptomyces bauhiniae]